MTAGTQDREEKPLSKINSRKRDDILLRMGQEQENEIEKLNENVNVLFEALNQLNQEKRFRKKSNPSSCLGL